MIRSRGGREMEISGDDDGDELVGVPDESAVPVVVWSYVCSAGLMVRM